MRTYKIHNLVTIANEYGIVVTEADLQKWLHKLDDQSELEMGDAWTGCDTVDVNVCDGWLADVGEYAYRGECFPVLSNIGERVDVTIATFDLQIFEDGKEFEGYKPSEDEGWY